jgi:hypothetical protein
MSNNLPIRLYSTNVRIRSIIRDSFPEVVEYIERDVVGRIQLPDRVDAVVSYAALNSATEGLAAKLALAQRRNDVYAVVIPEGIDWLSNRLHKLGSLTLVGADQNKWR